MAIEFTFSYVQAAVVAIALPIVAVGLFYLLIPRLKERSGGRLRRYLSYSITPPRIGSDSPEDEEMQTPDMPWRNDKIRLYFYYITAVLFLVSFTISEFYDRDRQAFYRAIQGVRERGLDLTGWLDYYVTGLAAQMVEVKQRGERVIQRDVLVQRHRLNERQSKALAHLMQHGRLTIRDLEVLCPDVNRRSLQRDLKLMVDKELLRSEGATCRLGYVLND